MRYRLMLMLTLCLLAAACAADRRPVQGEPVHGESGGGGSM